MENSLRHVEICPVDNPMDSRGTLRIPVNLLPEKCDYCTFPDLDFVPQPYLLSRGLESPKEFSPLPLGDFVVRERVRRILEIVVPEQLDFHSTCDFKTRQPTAWTLAVPKTQVHLYDIDSKVPRCPRCGEPKVAHPGSHYISPTRPHGAIVADVFKTLEWGSYETIGEKANWYWMHVLKLKAEPRVPEHQWTRVILSRRLRMSLRLEVLLKRLKIGSVARTAFQHEKASPQDIAWAEEKLQLAAQGGLTGAAPSRHPASTTRRTDK